MMRWYNSRPLSVKFLLLALPPSILVGLFFLGFVLLNQARLLEENNRGYAQSLAVRDAELLSRPLWNLEESSVLAILETIKAEQRLTCLELVNVLGFEDYPTYGNCSPQPNTVTLLQPIIFNDLQGQHRLGELRLALDISADTHTLFQSAIILGGQILLMLTALSIGIFWGFRATILRPISEVSESIKAFRRTGVRQVVDCSSDDELGQLIREYNSGLVSQQESERAILQASREFETTIQSLPFALILVNSSHEVIATNDAFEQQFSYSDWDQETIDTWCLQAFPDEVYREESIALMGIHIAHANKTGRQTDPLVREIKDTLGRTRTTEIRYFSLETRGVFTLTDITSHKHAEREIAKSAERFETTIKNLPFALAVTNSDQELEMVNTEFTRLFGYELSDIDSYSDWLAQSRPLPGSQVLPGALQDLASLASTSGQVVGPIEAQVGDKSGYYIPVEARLLQLTDRNIWAMTDITERVKAQIQLRQARDHAEQMLNELRITQSSLIQSEKLASLGSLVAGIAHEINTPVGIGVTVASSLGDRLKRIKEATESGALRKSDFEQFIREVDEATVLLNSSLSNAAHLIQDFKQVAADQTSSQRRRFNLLTVVSEVMSTLSPKLKHTRHKVIEQIDPDIVMDSYPGPLGQIITNLVNNALIHAFEGIKQGTIQVTAYRDDEHQAARILFKDSGCGMSEEQLTRIFDPFYTTRMGDGGTGLGMNIVYNITNNILGGTINVTSKLGGGTLFELRLPLTAPVTNSRDHL
ncbi:ATP-binding protein [Aestuariirhabdus litorea]|uniref:histidine kinase n=1 Tax=Aestuariirhabdus litorea TaxID=2528527 RepID=A0A3P3VPB2_9GAMM|nr:ATP-binding protein [Aestuariirhabdus litorea]RRJ84545.1 PAS domain-containing protein [Aestuariirhabdus litorea]RWW97771.1 PAS domain-containing protein [Endozoicomonadaceae bacterium GTF-13]